MSKKISVHHTTGATLSAIIWGSDRSFRWNGSAMVESKDISDANWAVGAIPLAENETSDATGTSQYIGIAPGLALVDPGEYQIDIFTTAAPTPGSARLTSQLINVESSVFRRSRGTQVSVTRAYRQNGFTSLGFGVTRFYLATHHTARVRMPGTVIGAKIYLGGSDGGNTGGDEVASLTFQIWRWTESGEIYDEVGSSEIIANPGWTESAWNTITFASPIPGVQRGDVMSVTAVNQNTNSVETIGVDTATPVSQNEAQMRLSANSGSTTFSGDAQNFGSLTDVPWGMSMAALMDSPTVITFGDSFMSARDHTEGFLFLAADVDWTANNLGNSIIERLYDRDPILFNGMTHGLGSTSSSSTDSNNGWLADRDDSPSDEDVAVDSTWLVEEVLNYVPRFAIISLGANDAVGGAQTVQINTFRQNIMTISHKLLAADIVPVWLGVFHTNTTTDRRESYRTYNDEIKKYCGERHLPFIDVQALLDGFTDSNGSGSNWGRDGRNVAEFSIGAHGNTDVPKAAAEIIHAELLRRGW